MSASWLSKANEIMHLPFRSKLRTMSCLFENLLLWNIQTKNKQRFVLPKLFYSEKQQITLVCLYACVCFSQIVVTCSNPEQLFQRLLTSFILLLSTIRCSPAWIVPYLSLDFFLAQCTALSGMIILTRVKKGFYVKKTPYNSTFCQLTKIIHLHI